MSNLRKFKRQIKKSPYTIEKIRGEIKNRLNQKAENQVLFGYNPTNWDYSQSLLCRLNKPKDQ